MVWLSHADTDRVLDFVVNSKKCYKCQQQKNVPLEDRKAHERTANFSASSTEMGRAAAVEMFERFQSVGLIYQTLESDGDSKAFIDLRRLCHIIWNLQRARKGAAEVH